MKPEIIQKIENLKSLLEEAEGEIKESVYVYFEYLKELSNLPNENWVITSLDYVENRIRVNMHWEAFWSYGGHDSGDYQFSIPYNLLDQKELDTFLVTKRKELEEEKREAQAKIRYQKEQRELNLYKELKNKFGEI